MVIDEAFPVDEPTIRNNELVLTSRLLRLCHKSLLFFPSFFEGFYLLVAAEVRTVDQVRIRLKGSEL